MHIIKKSSIYCWAVVACIFILAAIFQAHMLINWDVSFLLYVSERSLASGSYLKNIFFATPTILHLYMLPILISKNFMVNTIWALNITVFLFALISLMISYPLLRNIFLEKDNHLFYCLFISLTLVFLILPMHQFGQREHFMVIMTFPYFCLATLRLKNEKINFYLALFIGLFAGIGFSIKPFFLINFALVELYILFNKRKILSWIRIESIAILAISFFYTASLYIFFPDFFHLYLPMFYDLYYGENGNIDYTLFIIFSTPGVLFSFFSIIFYGIAHKKSDYPEFSKILLLTLIGSLIMYFSQQSSYYYRILPAVGQAILLCILVFTLNMSSYFIYEKKRSSYHNIAIGLLSGFLIFYYPISNTYSTIQNAFQFKQKQTHNDLAKFLKKYPTPVTSYFICSNCYLQYSLSNYLNLKLSSQFFNLWWIPGIVKKEQLALNIQPKNLMNEKKYFFNQVVSELKNEKPYLVFVDTKIGIFHKNKFDFLAFFNQDKSFQEVWKSYQFLQTVDNFNIYRRSNPE